MSSGKDSAATNSLQTTEVMLQRLWDHGASLARDGEDLAGIGLLLNSLAILMQDHSSLSASQRNILRADKIAGVIEALKDIDKKKATVTSQELQVGSHCPPLFPRNVPKRLLTHFTPECVMLVLSGMGLHLFHSDGENGRASRGKGAGWHKEDHQNAAHVLGGKPRKAAELGHGMALHQRPLSHQHSHRTLVRDPRANPSLPQS